MYNIDFHALFLLLVVTGIIFSILYLLTPLSNRRLYLTFITLSVLIYSGIGTSYTQIDDKYLGKFLIFITVLLLTIFFVFKKNKSKVYTKSQSFISVLDLTSNIYVKIYMLLSFIYLLSLFVNLLVPTVRINQLWNPPAPSIIEILSRRDSIKANTILHFADTINIFLQPFFFLYLYSLRKHKKYVSLTLWIFGWIYLDYLSLGYWGRSDMIVYVIFIFFLYIFDFEKGYKLKKRHIVFLICGIIIASPFLLGYESFRAGNNINNISFADSFIRLFEKETDYPKYYSIIESLTNYVSASDYFKWLITLPIPSIIVPSKFYLGINTVFSSAILGVSRGQIGYTVILPSLLGEAFMIYSTDFYWIHAIVVGVIVAYTCILSERSRTLSILNLYYAVQLLLIGRGGSQGYIGLVINGSVSIVVWVLFLKLVMYKNKRYYSMTNYDKS